MQDISTDVVTPLDWLPVQCSASDPLKYLSPPSSLDLVCAKLQADIENTCPPLKLNACSLEETVEKIKSFYNLEFVPTQVVSSDILPTAFTALGDCYEGTGDTYIGTHSTSMTLKQCTPWPSQQYTLELLEGSKLGLKGAASYFGVMHNYCR